MGFWSGLKASYSPEQWSSGTSTSYLDDIMPGGFTSFTGAYKPFLDIYRGSPAVRMVISFRSNNTASLPLKVYRRVDDDVREAINDHGLALTLDFPNSEDTTHTFIRDLTTDLDIFDVTFWKKRRIKSQLLLVRMYPDSISMQGGDELAPEFFREQYSDGTYRDHARDDVLWLHGYGSRRGISPMETLKQILQEDDDEALGRRAMAKNAWRSTGVIQRPANAPVWDDTGRRRFNEQMLDRYTGGANAGKPLLLEEGMTWQSDDMSMRSMEYTAARELTTKTVSLAFHMSPQIMGLEGAPYASITEYNRQLYTNVLAPRLHFLEQGLKKQLVPDFKDPEGVYCEFALEAKLRGSFKEQADIAMLALGGKAWMTVTEWRAKMNLPPLSEDEMTELNPAPVAPNPGPVPGAEQDQPRPSDNELSLDRTAQKAAPRGAVTRRDESAEVLEKIVAKHVERTRGSAKSKGLGNRDRWDRELKNDLRPAIELIVTAEATRKAARLGGDYDPKNHQHYLDEVADGAAKGFNGQIDKTLEVHSDDPAAAYGESLPSMGAKFALGMATGMFSFARSEAAKQNGGGKKTWIVTSSKSRHPHMNGESVDLYKTFSNGMQYPGAGSVDESAGCKCLLDVSGGKSADGVYVDSRVFNHTHNHFPEPQKQEPPIVNNNVNVESPVNNMPESPPPIVNVLAARPRKTMKTVHRDDKGRVATVTEVDE